MSSNEPLLIHKESYDYRAANKERRSVEELEYKCLMKGLLQLRKPRN